MRTIVVCLVLVAAVGLLYSGECAAAKNAVLKEQAVREAVTGFIMEKTAESGLEIRIGRIGYSGDITVPAGRVSFDVVVPQQWEGWGKAVLGLVVRVDDRVVRNTSVPVEVEALTEMVVALRPLERGEVIRDGDVALQKRDLATAPPKICRDSAEAVGKRARIGLKANAPIRSDFLEKVPLVKYGQPVTIIAENGALRVTAAGKAKGTGAEGDLIPVENLGSRKDVRARVLDSGSVAVEFQ